MPERHFNNLIVMLLVGCLALGMLGAQPAQSAADLAENVQQLVSKYEVQSRARVGVSVVDVSSSARLVDIRKGELFVPASNAKLLTAAAALGRLGENFQFTTKVYFNSRDVIIIGDYDPTLGDPKLAAAAGRSIYAELDRWANAIRAKALAGTIGNIILSDDPRSVGAYRHGDWPKSQHSRWYAAPVAPLNFHDNCFDVTFKLSGGELIPIIAPASRFFQVVNSLRPGRRQLWSLRTSEDCATVTISGTVKSATSKPVSVAVDNPPLFLGSVLADRIERAGLSFTGAIRLAQPGEIDLSGSIIAARTTTPLAVAVRRAMKDSLNLAAESLLLRGGDGTWLGSAKISTETLVKTFGLKQTDMVISDGSGLARSNRVTPEALTSLLGKLLSRPDGGVVFDSLPVSGKDGTLRKRLTTPPCQGRVVAKSGYIAGVSCLSGYVLDAAGKPAATFSIMVNDVPGGQSWRAKTLQDNICRQVVDFLDAR